MARINKWIYSWERYINIPNVTNGWEYSMTYNCYGAYKSMRKISNRLPYPVKWKECRKPNPEYKGD